MSTPLIEKLTPAQEARKKKAFEEGMKVGWSTERSNRPKAEKAIRALYKLNGAKKMPEFVWCDSPLAAAKIIKESTGSWPSLSGTDGNLDIPWVATYNFCKTIKQTINGKVVQVKYKKENEEQLKIWTDLAYSTGPCFPYENYCLMTERPTIAKHDERGRLHSEDSAALAYLDGFEIYAINGVTVNKQIVMEPWTITLEQIEKESNTDIQTIMQDRWCYEEFEADGKTRKGINGGRYLEETGAKVIHEDSYTHTVNGQTVTSLRALLEDKNGNKFLAASDSSTPRVYFIRADNTAKTCEEAHKSFNGGHADSAFIAHS